MSLINDALKRASQAQPTTPPLTETAPPLRAAEHKRPSSWPIVVLPLVLLFVLAMAGWFLVKGYHAARQLAETRVPVSAREISQPEPAGTQAGQFGKDTNYPALAATQKVAAQPSVTNAEPIPAESVPPVAPALKLQGIFYRPARPAAMINSKTVFVGDKVAQAKVVAIDRESVTLESEGQTKVLTLP